MNKNLIKAIGILKNGGIVIFPTDTAFGIGVRIDNKKAIEKLIKIRGRKRFKPFPVLVDSIKMAKTYLKPVDKEVNQLMKKHWPGGLTIVLPCLKEKVNPLIKGNDNTLGVRMPNHKQTLSLIKGVGVPIIGCSANFPNDKTPFSLKEVDKKLIKSVDFVLNGRCLKKKQSTVINCSKKPWKILRPGVVNLKSKNIELFINTSSNKYVMVGIKINQKQFIEKKEIDYQKAQAILPMIKKILKKHKLSFNDLTSIKVNQGPGSYTGLRVGLSVANALSHFLNISINKKEGKILEPHY